jgi:tyrosyl-tRNA synthetase
MNAMVPGLAGGKMSSSDPNSKIDFLDTAEMIRKKIKLAFCEEGNVADNGLLAFVEAVLIPISQMRLERQSGDAFARDEGQAVVGDQKPFVTEDAPGGTVFTIERDAKFGGSTHYRSFEEMQKDFADKMLHPKDLKASVANAINRLLDPIRKAFEESDEWQEVAKLAYPDANAKPEKKKKKVVLALCLCFSWFDSMCISKEKVYHPPPPGKGKSNSTVEEPSAGVIELSDPVVEVADP